MSTGAEKERNARGEYFQWLAEQPEKVRKPYEGRFVAVADVGSGPEIIGSSERVEDLVADVNQKYATGTNVLFTFMPKRRSLRTSKIIDLPYLTNRVVEALPRAD